MKEHIQKAYKFRIYPDEEQRIFFAKHFGCSRFIYNYLLNERKNAYQKEGRKLSGFECKKLISPLKEDENYLWLKEVNSQSLQEAALDLNNAYERFFKKISDAKYPRFKKKSDKQSFKVPQYFFVDKKNGTIKIPKLKTLIKTKFHRELKKVKKICFLTFSQTPSNQYFVYLNVEEEVIHKKPVGIITKSTKVVGIDLGITSYLVESNGRKIESPKYLCQSEKKLKKEQRKLSRKIKGSKNRHKQKIKVAMIHFKIKNQRHDFLHRQSFRLVNENQVICLETLNVKGMMRNRRLSKAIGDCAWSEFGRQLKYKAKWKGVQIVSIGRWEASSKPCSHCGYKKEDLKLTDRNWKCPDCQTIHDRDINAAKNIEKIGRVTPELTPVKRRTSVFSLSKTQARSLKQESLAVS